MDLYSPEFRIALQQLQILCRFREQRIIDHISQQFFSLVQCLIQFGVALFDIIHDGAGGRNAEPVDPGFCTVTFQCGRIGLPERSEIDIAQVSVNIDDHGSNLQNIELTAETGKFFRRTFRPDDQSVFPAESHVVAVQKDIAHKGHVRFQNII